MAKLCKHVDIEKCTALKPQAQIDWEKCCLCQEERAEPLQCPAESKRQDAGAGYKSLGNKLQEFSELGELDESVDLGRLDEGDGI